MQTFLVFVKTIMTGEGTIVGSILSLLYFQDVTSRFLKEGVITSVVWII